MTRLLLDTNVLLWMAQDDPRLTSKARIHIEAAEQLLFSAVTIWEIAIKSRLGKLNADAQSIAQGAILNRLVELPLYSRHAATVGGLPLHHGDPFDRLLVAQAIVDQLRC